MIVKDIKRHEAKSDVFEMSISDGFLQGSGASLPDIDLDTQSDKREDVRLYIEGRYNTGGQQRVFSAGTLTTLKIKAALKDVGRTCYVPSSTVNYITKIISDDSLDFTGFIKLAVSNKRVRQFVEAFPKVIENMRTLLGQPRSTSIHASAVIPVPATLNGKKMECFDYVPIRNMDGKLVSELDGYTCDERGLLKLDALNTKELQKLSEMFNLVREHYDVDLSLEKIEQELRDEPEVYECFQQGYTQDIFQFGSEGITKLTMDVQPTTIEDLTAINALYRPATIELGYTESFGRFKRGECEPVYAWGTYEATKNTFGLLVYQESMISIANQVGGLSLTDGVRLVKHISKKKVDKILEYKEKFIAGAIKKGCPEEEAKAIWHNFEAAGKYLFNKCIAGSETIYRHQKSVNPKLYAPTIHEMYMIKNDINYAKKHGKMSLRGKYLRNGYGIAYSLNDKNLLVMNRIKDIQPSGIREVFEVKLKNGASIRVTDNHKFPTNRGEVVTSDLIVGSDKLFFKVGHKKEDTEYRFTDKGKKNILYHSNATDPDAYTYNSEIGKCGFQFRDSRFTKLGFYKKNLKKDYCEICGSKNVRLEVHHIDGDHGNSDVKNLCTCCSSCHKKKHYEMGRVKIGEKGLYTELIDIESIISCGVEQTYDVEMHDPYHTYTTKTGIVTCNSHATAYSLLSYAGMYIKCHFPTVFYTVTLGFCKDEDIPSLVNEMEKFTKCRVIHPDINKSDASFRADYRKQEIYWSLTRIKFVAAKATQMIVENRNRLGEFKSFNDFYARMKFDVETLKDQCTYQGIRFTNPLSIRTLENLILSGCFDEIEGVKDITERMWIINKLYDNDAPEKKYPKENISQAHWWSFKQIELSNIGAVDYKRILDLTKVAASVKNVTYRDFEYLLKLGNDSGKALVCATISSIEEKSYTDKQSGQPKVFCKAILQENNKQIEMIMWDKAWDKFKDEFKGKAGSIFVGVCHLQYSTYNSSNALQLNDTSFVKILK